MVHNGLGKRLDDIATGQTDPAIVLSLLQWAERTDSVPELMQAAAHANPTNVALKQAARDCASWFGGEMTANPPPGDAVKHVAQAPASRPSFPGGAQGKDSAANQALPGFSISYNKADRHWAEWIAWQLEAEGYTTIIQAWDFRPGSNFVLEMQQATAEAQRTIAVLSPDYLASRFTAPEWAAAFAQDPTGEQGKLLPVRVRNCELQGLLPQVVYIDLVELDEAAALAALLSGVKHSRAKPVVAPAFPGAAAAIPHTSAERPSFPGRLPSVWNVPQRRNPNFAGRDAQLEQLHTAFGSGKPGSSVQVLTGLGGIGKTQTAVEYAYRYAGDYDVVWWARAEEPAVLTGDLAQVASSLQLPEAAETDQLKALRATLRWLGSHNRWLLVLDNATEPAAVRAYLPGGDTGHVLVTTRNPAGWGRLGAAQYMPVLAPPGAVEFLLRRSGEDDAEGAASLAEELGYLPLALEQAGAYMEQSGKSAVEYLRLYRTRSRDLLSRGRPESDYPDTVLTTWSLAFNAASKAAGAGELLNLCAYLAPNDISLERINDGAAKLPRKLAAVVADEMACDDAITGLRRYSLVQVNDGRLDVHRLVQAVARDRLSPAKQKQWAGAAVRLVNDAFPQESYDVRTWAECDTLLPHALAAAGHAEVLSSEPEAVGRLLNQVGLYLNGRARFTEAKPYFERSLAIREQVLGAMHPSTASSLNNLGLLLRDMGDYAGAKPYLERSLAIFEHVLGTMHPDTARGLNNLGMLLHDMGDYAGAKPYLERSLAIREQVLGAMHPDTAISLNNLGMLLRDMGDLAGAKPYLERALAIDETASGPDHPDVATGLNNVGLLLRDMGDLAGAKPYLERSLAIFEYVLGAMHPDTATSLNNLGMLLHDMGDLTGAKPYLERSLAIREQVLGAMHPSTAISLNNLGLLLQDMGDVAGAKPYYERSLAILEQVLGAMHPDTANVRSNLETLESSGEG